MGGELDSVNEMIARDDAAAYAYHSDNSYDPVTGLPAEMVADTSNPANAEYFRIIDNIKRNIVKIQLSMPPFHVDIIKKAHGNIPFERIAETLKTDELTIRRVLKSKNGKRLRVMLIHLQMAIEGPNEAQRRNMLYQIMQANMLDDPRVTISAIAEINKMDYQAKQLEQGMSSGQTVNITINTDQLPKTVLDV